MDIYTENTEEYVVSRLCLCGEIEQSALLTSSPAAPGTVYRVIKDLRKKRVIIKHRYEDGRTFLRLSSQSTQYIDSLSPALLANAMHIVNTDLKYSGSKQVRMRERANSEFYSACVDHGIRINSLLCIHEQKDNFTCERAERSRGESIFCNDRYPLPFEKIAESLGDHYTGLFTKRIIKKKTDEGITHEGSRTSRITGTLFLTGQVYQTYALLDPERSSWKPEAEFTAANYISGTIERNCPYYNNKGVRVDNKAILLFPSAASAEKMVSLYAEKVLRIDPCRLYEESYVIPSYKMDLSVIKLLSRPGWKTEIADILFPEGRHDGVADVNTEDGKEVYNLIGCELNRIRTIMPRILNIEKPIVLLTEEWMSESIRKVFGKDNIEIVSFSPDDIAVIAESIDSYPRPAHPE